MNAISSVARAQQGLTLLTLLAALAWALAVGPQSPILAAAGAFALASPHLWLLGLQGALLAFIGPPDPAPRPTATQWLRAWLLESLQALRLLAWRQPLRWQAVPDQTEGPGLAGRHGVVFIHGFVCNRGFWNPWLQRLRVDGRAYVALNLEPAFGAIETYLPQVEEAVHRVRRATGLPPVLVCHSMGGLVARAWLCTQARDDAVAHGVTIGTPHHGNWMARGVPTANARQMRQGSAWMRALEQAWTPARGMHWTCWWGNADQLVLPVSTAALEGADNRLLTGTGHLTLAFHPEVLQATFERLQVLDAAVPPRERKGISAMAATG